MTIPRLDRKTLAPTVINLDEIRSLRCNACGSYELTEHLGVLKCPCGHYQAHPKTVLPPIPAAAPLESLPAKKTAASPSASPSLWKRAKRHLGYLLHGLTVCCAWLVLLAFLGLVATLFVGYIGIAFFDASPDQLQQVLFDEVIVLATLGIVLVAGLLGSVEVPFRKKRR